MGAVHHGGKSIALILSDDEEHKIEKLADLSQRMQAGCNKSQLSTPATRVRLTGIRAALPGQQEHSGMLTGAARP